MQMIDDQGEGGISDGQRAVSMFRYHETKEKRTDTAL